MSYEEQHIKSWADKLQQAPLPDVDTSWKNMEQLLDQHLQAPEKERKRRFLFLLLPIMLLIIGICALIDFQQFVDSNKKQEIATTPDSTTWRDTKSAIPNRVGNNEEAIITINPVRTFNKPSTGDSIKAHHYIIKGNELIKNNGGEIAAKTSVAIQQSKGAKPKHRSANANSASKINYSNKAASLPVTKKINNSNENVKGINKEGNVVVTPKSNRQIKRNNNLTNRLISTVKGRNHTEVSLSKRNRRNTIFRDEAALIDRSAIFIAKLLYKDRLDPLGRIILIDSFREGTIPDSIWQSTNKKERILRKGWISGIGINHFFLVSAQSSEKEIKEIDAEGISKSITDYIPVPQVQYHFNNRLFVQAELQFNTPQFTQRVLLEKDTTQQGSLVISDAVYIRKLSYFNLPLSVHYSPVKNLYLGAGIQLSRLNNAIAIIEQSVKQGQAQDTIKTQKVQSIKNDTTYKRLHTSEFRLFGDVGYQVKRFTAGMRYNYALRDFVKVPITTTGSITQARNHSLQVYLRYTFLDKRKKIKAH